MTAWTGTPALPAGLSGQILNSATDFAAILAAIHGLTDAWSSYTPVWSSSGTQPALVNGVIEGRYTQSNKLVLCTGRLLMGSSTTFGTGTYSISLPVTSESGNRYNGCGIALDSSTAANNQPVGVRMNGTTVMRFYGTGGELSPTVPFTWTSGDTLLWSLLYPAA